MKINVDVNSNFDTLYRFIGGKALQLMDIVEDYNKEREFMEYLETHFDWDLDLRVVERQIAEDKLNILNHLKIQIKDEWC